MSDSNLPFNTPQFSTAEYPDTKSGQCAACKQPITGRYYSINNKIACESCMQQVAHRFPKDSHSAYMRGILFGVGAAIIVGIRIAWRITAGSRGINIQGPYDKSLAASV